VEPVELQEIAEGREVLQELLGLVPLSPLEKKCVFKNESKFLPLLLFAPSE